MGLLLLNRILLLIMHNLQDNDYDVDQYYYYIDYYWQVDDDDDDDIIGLKVGIQLKGWTDI